MRLITEKTTSGGTGGAPVSAPAVGAVAIPRALNGNKTACSAVDKRVSNCRALICTTPNWGMALDRRFGPYGRPALAGAQTDTPAKERAQRQAGCERTEIGHQRLEGIERRSFHALDYTHGEAAA